MKKIWTQEQRELYAERDKTIPLKNFEGVCQKLHYNGDVNKVGVFLFGIDGIKYDLPRWAEEYHNKEVTIIGRHVQKNVGEKIYNKIIVVSLKEKQQEEENNDKGDDGHIHSV